MKKIVISAVNLKVGGTLTILRDCLRHLSGLAATGEYQVIALVYDRKVADYPHVEYIEMAEEELVQQALVRVCRHA